MKRFTLLATAAALFAFASCGENKKGEPFNPASIAGTYHGYTIATTIVQSANSTTGEQTVVIKAETNGKISLSYTHRMWGEYVVEDLKAVKTGNVCTISGEGIVTVARDPESPKDFPFTVKGTITAIDDAQITIEAPGVMGLKMEFATGTAPEEESGK